VPSYAMAYDIANRLVKYAESQKIADKASLLETARKYYAMSKDNIDTVVEHNTGLGIDDTRMRYNDVSVSIVDKNPDILYNVNGYSNDNAKNVIKRTGLQRVIIEERGTKF
jgi:hypothetical protein